jgi:hypothetical protein
MQAAKRTGVPMHRPLAKSKAIISSFAVQQRFPAPSKRRPRGLPSSATPFAENTRTLIACYGVRPAERALVGYDDTAIRRHRQIERTEVWVIHQPARQRESAPPLALKARRSLSGAIHAARARNDECHFDYLNLLPQTLTMVHAAALWQ